MLGDVRPVILHLLNTFEGGGTEKGLLRLLGEFDRKSFRHVVVTLRGAGVWASHLPDDVGCHALETSGQFRYLGPAIARIVKQERARLLHARNTCCWADATLAKILVPRLQLVLGFHGLDHAGRFSRKDRIVAAAARHFSARFATVSESGREKIIHELHVPAARVHTLPNGIAARTTDAPPEKNRFRIRSQFGLSPTDYVIGIVGSLTPVKRHDLLLSAIAKLRPTIPHVRLLVIGDGPCRAALENECRKRRLHKTVIFSGWRDDVEACLDAIDVYACTSDSEGMNTAILEALAHGLPIVASDAGDNASVIRHNVDGLIVPRGDATAIASAVSRLATESDLACQLRDAARRRSLRYRLDFAAQQYDRFYQAIVADQQKGRPTQAGCDAAAPTPA